jgi:ATP-dependent Clp protease ATP-binding subunit ClpX
MGRDKLSGARGLRSVIESVMLEVMYEVPSVEGISEIKIGEDVVRGEGELEYVTIQEYGVTS